MVTTTQTTGAIAKTDCFADIMEIAISLSLVQVFSSHVTLQKKTKIYIHVVIGIFNFLA